VHFPPEPPRTPHARALQEVLKAGGHVAILARKQQLLDGACPAIQPQQSGTVWWTGHGMHANPMHLHAPAHHVRHRSTPPTCAEAARELQAWTDGGRLRLTTHSADVSDEGSMTTVMAAITAAHGGPIDAVVSCAGITLPRRFEETATGDWGHLFKVNVLGNRNTVFTALPHMAPHPGAASRTGSGKASGSEPAGGRIVIVSSQAGQSGLYGYAAYSVSARRGCT